MALLWTAKRQLFYLVVFLLIILLLLVFVWLKITTPSCFDNKQNQEEEGVDCGGPCEKLCLGEVKEIAILWSKTFEIKNGRYDAVAVVKNTNINLIIPSLKYRFKLYDKNNILISIRDGGTFVNAGESFAIFETNIDTGERVAERAFLELEENPRWERAKKERTSLLVSQKQFSNLPSPRLMAAIENKSISEVKNISSVAILYDKDKNALGASATRIDMIRGGESKEIIFTWPQSFKEEPSSIEIFLRTEL